VPADALRSTGERWKVVIDYPFDEALHSPEEDLERLDRWRSENGPTQTVCWVPAFLSTTLQQQLGRLVVIEHVLEGERLLQYADHLSRQDQQLARVQLEDHAGVLRETLRGAIRQAYGVERPVEGTIAETHEPELRLQSLKEGFRPQLPIGATLRAAFEGLVRAMLDSQYPDHPLFDEELRPRDLRIVWEEVQRALESGGRIDHVASDRRRVLRRIANPLEIGTQHDAPFVVSSTWKDRLDQGLALARSRGELERVTVADLRRLTDEPRPRGLTPEVSALVVLTYARQTGRTFRLQNGPPGEVGIDRLPGELELVAASLPDEPSWETAQRRAQALFGLGGLNPARTAASVAAFADAVTDRAAAATAAAAALVLALERRLGQLFIDASEAERAQSAIAGRALVDACGRAGDPVELVEVVATAELPTSAQAVGASLSTAAEIARRLEDERWLVIERFLAASPSSGRDAALDRLRETISRDEFSAPLEPAIAAAYHAGIELISTPSPEPPPQPSLEPPEPSAEPTPAPAPDAWRGHAERLTIAQARAQLDELEARGDSLVIDLTWTSTEH
jgi:hypothetical protein